MTNNNERPLMSRKKQGFVQAVIILVVVAIGVAYFLGTRKNNSRSTVPSIVPVGTPVATQSSNPAINPDQEAINNLVKNFYSALELQDGKLLFSFLTPPLTPQEKEGFNWLTGADLGTDSFYRVFLRVKISSPRIDDIQKVNDTTFVVRITDQIQGYSNAQNAGWSSPQPRYNVLLTVIKSGDTWLVDKFTDTLNTASTGNAGTPKYNGFGQ